MSGSQTPIDIHCSKLVDWLVQRRHCRKDWGENLASIRRKIRSALGDMPENDEIKQLLIGSKLDYFKSKTIVEILKTTEASSKNIFGFYSSQRMKDWQDIVNSYERDHIYLAEIATDLIRETNYEVPAIRKVIGRLRQDKDEAEREKANLLKRAQQFNSEYQRLAQSYGIMGVNIEQEFLDQSNTLSAAMEEIVDLSRGLKDALDYYRNYSGSISKQDSSKFAPTLYYVITNGNTTVYEWRYGHVPEGIIVDDRTNSAGNSNPSEIELLDDEIDFGEDLPSSESSSGFVHVDKSDNGNGNIDETFIKLEDNESNIVCDVVNDKMARGDDAKLVLELRKPRNQFLNNLHELEAFLVQLLLDLSNDDDRSSTFMAEGSSRVRRYDATDLNQLIAIVRNILSIMNNEKNKTLFQINDSPIFLENIKETFANKLKQASECSTKADLLAEHISELENQIKDTNVQLKKSIVSAKGLQERVENSIREIYSGRPINIMGCVN